MSGYQMFLPVMPDGTVMDMFPLRSADAALIAAAHFLPEPMNAADLSESPALAPSCWRAAGRGWGFSDSLAVEMAKAHGYSTVEVFLQPVERPKP